jgi:peptidyl-prolyl cis-trans isomerase SurA
MKVKILFFFIIFVANLNFTLDAKEITKIVVKIENEIITNYDIKSEILATLILTKKEINQKNINDLKQNALENLIQNRLKKIELKKYNFTRNESKINQYLNSISSNNIQNIKSLFQENGIDYKSFVDNIDIELKWRNLIFNNFSKKIEINLNDIDREVKKILLNNENLISYNLSEIEIKKSEEKIIQVLNELKNTNFEDAVIKLSISSTSKNRGELGWVNSNLLSKEISETLEVMKIGEVSKPINRQNTVIFLKLNDKKILENSKINIDNLKSELINQKKNELFSLYSNSLLSKLRNTKFIEYYK